MRIWLVKDGEYLPLQPGARRMRIGMLASYLAGRGHQVVWWSSSFAHVGKTLLSRVDQVHQIEPGYSLRLLYSGAYSGNISVARLIHHNRFALRLAGAFPRQPPPDIIVCCYPIIEMALQTARFALPRRIPLIMDVRDAWPDYFVERTPRPLRWLTRLALYPLYWQGRQALSRADALVAISHGFLEWGLKMAGRSATPLDGVSYHGYEPVEPDSAPSPDVAALLEEVKNKVVFLFCGNFTAPYDLEGVCTVAERLKDRDDVAFLLAGDGTNFPTIQAQACTLQNTRLPGWLKQSDLQHLLRRCDVGLLPWASETRNAMPNKVFEYLAAGLPLISSSVGDLQRLLAEHEAGLSYAPRNVNELEGLIRTLATDEALRERLSQNARSAFDKHFRSGIICAHYEARILQVAERASGR